MTARWYVVQTKSSQEQFATDELEKQNFEVFYPAFMKHVRIGKRDVPKIYPLYPSYIFVKFDIAKTQWRSINGTRGVSSLIGMMRDDYVSPLPAGFVEEMLKEIDAYGLVSLEDSIEKMIEYAPGDQVVIKDNKFKDLVGICCSSTSDRIIVFLSLLSRKIKVSLTLRSVKPLENLKT